MRRIISILVENEAGSLARIIGLFAQRGYNIDSLNVAPTDEKSLSRITLVTNCDSKVLEQIVKQVNKLVNVHKVFEISKRDNYEVELALIKISRTERTKSAAELSSIANIYQAKIVAVGEDYFLLETINSSSQINRLLESLEQYNILEVSRTGVIAITQNSKALK